MFTVWRLQGLHIFFRLSFCLEGSRVESLGSGLGLRAYRVLL